MLNHFFHKMSVLGNVSDTFSDYKTKDEGKEQESIQSNTTPDPGHLVMHIGK